MGLSHLGRDKEGGKTVDVVPKEKILHDIQFRGAISDFYVLKSKVPWGYIGTDFVQSIGISVFLRGMFGVSSSEEGLQVLEEVLKDHLLQSIS